MANSIPSEMKEIVKEIEILTGLNPCLKTNIRSISYLRHISSYIGFWHHGSNQVEIAKFFGKDNSSIYYAINNGKNIIESDLFYRKIYYLVIRNLNIQDVKSISKGKNWTRRDSLKMRPVSFTRKEIIKFR